MFLPFTETNQGLVIIQGRTTKHVYLLQFKAKRASTVMMDEEDLQFEHFALAIVVIEVP